jgi:hypothetical protein
VLVALQTAETFGITCACGTRVQGSQHLDIDARIRNSELRKFSPPFAMPSEKLARKPRRSIISIERDSVGHRGRIVGVMLNE